MPAPSTNAGTQRAFHARRTRSRQGAPGSATAEGTRSSRNSEGKSEESEIIGAGLVSNNRFAVLRPNEPAPGIPGKRNSTPPLDPCFRPERPVILPLQTNIPPTNQLSSSKKMNEKPLAPDFPASPYSKRPLVPRLVPHKLARSTISETDQQPETSTAASILPTKNQPQPSPLVLHTDAQSARSRKQASVSSRTSPDFTTPDPYLSLLAPQSAPTLLSPPIPQHPLPSPSLASLPIHPSLDFKSFTIPRDSGPKPCQLTPPTPTSFDSFRKDDPMRRIVRTTSGKIFSIAAEIAAANAKSTMRPVGKVLIPGPAKKFCEVKGKIDREESKRRSGKYVSSPEEMEDESEDEQGEGEEWLGKDRDFWKQQFETGNAVKTKLQTKKEGSS